MRTGSGSDILIVVPAFNEQASIGRVIDELHAVVPLIDVMVIDDGSIDRTSEQAAAHGARVMRMPFNTGVGGAMRTGFRYALRQGYSAVIQVDADGQHDPRDIPALIAASAGGAEVVIGARFAGRGAYSVRGPRNWAMKLLALFLSRLSGVTLTDVTSGFRLSRGRALVLFARVFPEEYLGDTVESLVIAARADLVIAQVPVEMRARSGGEPSHSPVRSALYLLRAFLALLMAVARPIPSHLVDFSGGGEDAGRADRTDPLGMQATPGVAS